MIVGEIYDLIKRLQYDFLFVIEATNVIELFFCKNIYFTAPGTENHRPNAIECLMESQTWWDVHNSTLVLAYWSCFMPM